MADDLEARVAALEFANVRLREQLTEQRLMSRVFAKAVVATLAKGDALGFSEHFMTRLFRHLDEEKQAADQRAVDHAAAMIEWLYRFLIDSDDI